MVTERILNLIVWYFHPSFLHSALNCIPCIALDFVAVEHPAFIAPLPASTGQLPSFKDVGVWDQSRKISRHHSPTFFRSSYPVPRPPHLRVLSLFLQTRNGARYRTMFLCNVAVGKAKVKKSDNIISISNGEMSEGIGRLRPQTDTTTV